MIIKNRIKKKGQIKSIKNKRKTNERQKTKDQRPKRKTSDKRGRMKWPDLNSTRMFGLGIVFSFFSRTFWSR